MRDMIDPKHQLVIDAVNSLAIRMVAAGSDPVEIVHDLLDEFVRQADVLSNEMRAKTEYLNRIIQICNVERGKKK